MSTPGERLAKARKDAGYTGPAEAAAALDMSRFTYTQHENGTRGFKTDSAVRYARKFRVSLEWLQTGRGDPKGRETTVPVTQYVGAGAEVIAFPDQGSFDEEPVLDNLTGCEAALIRGDSMPPFKDGWLLIYRRDRDGVTEDCVGGLCLVDVKQGPTLVKILRKGSKRGLWTLESWNGPPRKDVLINWAAPILYIKPK